MLNIEDQHLTTSMNLECQLCRQWETYWADDYRSDNHQYRHDTGYRRTRMIKYCSVRTQHSRAPFPTKQKSRPPCPSSIRVQRAEHKDSFKISRSSTNGLTSASIWQVANGARTRSADGVPCSRVLALVTTGAKPRLLMGRLANASVIVALRSAHRDAMSDPC